MPYHSDVTIPDQLFNLRCKILEIANLAQEGHIPSSLSVLEIIFTYYSCHREPGNPLINSKFVLSKGHASLAYFVVLEHFGYIRESDLNSYAKFDSILGGHPDRLKVPSVVASTGSLGHGLPFSVGLALASKVKEEVEQVYVLVGDGEMNEGSNWEALLLASHHKLNNLNLIIDSNSSSDRAVELPQMQQKLESFGLEVSNCNGHDLDGIRSWMLGTMSSGPRALIANTIKGNGFKLLENNPAWHHAVPSLEQIEDIKRSAK